MSSLVQFGINEVFQNGTYRRCDKQTFTDTLGYTNHSTVIVVILISLACKRCRLARHLPYILFSCILIFFRLYFGSVGTSKYKLTTVADPDFQLRGGSPRPATAQNLSSLSHVAAMFSLKPSEALYKASVFCVSLPEDTHITSDMCAGIHPISRGYTYHCDTFPVSIPSQTS